MHIEFYGTVSETIAALKSVRAMAYEHNYVFGVTCDTIIKAENQIYGDLSELVEKCGEGFRRVLVTTDINFRNGHSCFRCYGQSGDDMGIIEFSRGEINEACEEE